MRLRCTLVLPIVLLAGCGSRLLGGDSVAHDETSTSASEDATTIEPSSTGPTTTSTTGGGMAPFLPDSDYSQSDPCDSWAQDCPDGEKCVPYASRGSFWDELKCVPIMGSQAPGEPCIYGGIEAATDDCDATSICWDTVELNGELIGVCRALCTGTPDNPMCLDGSQCVVPGDGLLHLCIPTCDPLLQECDEGFGCYWTNFDFGCVLTTTNLPTGDPCGFVNDCAPGNICIDGSALPACMGAACCTNYCDLQLGDVQCEMLPGTSCVAFFEQDMAPPAYENVGLCIVP